jgi:SulP family sulfate permease
MFGGMAGCAMIGQSVINVKSGGRGRLSTFVAGAFLLFLILVLSDWVRQIPMAALVAVMIMVSIGTFRWSSVLNLRTMPKSSSLVMITTVVVVVFTHNLAQGVFVGVLMSALFFARKVSRMLIVESTLAEHGRQRTYTVHGQVFFVSATQFSESFDFKERLDTLTIDVSNAHFWDYTAVGALDKVILKFRREGVTVNIIGMNQASTTLINNLGVYDKSEALETPAHH